VWIVNWNKACWVFTYRQHYKSTIAFYLQFISILVLSDLALFSIVGKLINVQSVAKFKRSSDYLSDASTGFRILFPVVVECKTVEIKMYSKTCLNAI